MILDVPPPNFSALQPDQNFTAIALANVTGQTLPVQAGGSHRFEFTIVFRSAALTTGIRLGMVVPAFSLFAATVRIPTAVDGVAAMTFGWLSTSGDSVVTTGVPTAATDHLAIISGLIVPSVDGVIQVQAATEVAASTVTIRGGSQSWVWGW